MLCYNKENRRVEEMDEILKQAKPYLKEQGFNRYEYRITNEIGINVNAAGLFESQNPIGKVQNKNIAIHSFMNDNRGYSVDLSIEHICVKVNTIRYIPFEEYASIFIYVSNIYKSTIDFFTMKRFGLRKINFCFVDHINRVKEYFNPRYFDCYDLFDDAEISASEKKENFLINECKMNLLCDIEKGELGKRPMYKVTLDLDIYIDNTDDIERYIFTNKHIFSLNDRLFAIYVDALTEKFTEILVSDEDINEEGIVGVERNE